MAKDKTKPRPDLIAKRQADKVRQAAKKRKERRRIFVNWVIGLTIIGLAVWGVFIVINHVQNDIDDDVVTGNADVQITPPNMATDGLSIVGNTDVPPAPEAPVVDLYSDYQCDGCIAKMQYFGPGLIQLAEQGQIVLRYHLSMAQDDALKNTTSGRANVAAACADTVGQFLSYSQVLFEAAAGAMAAGVPVAFTSDQLANDYATSAGISGSDLKTFQQCFQQRATSAFITNMSETNANRPIPDNPDYSAGVSITDDLVVFSNQAEVDLMLAYVQEQPVNNDELLYLLSSAAGQ